MNIRIAQTSQELKDVYSIRRDVFINEQNVPEELELDGLDEEAILLIGYHLETPVAAGRIRLLEGCGKLERISVLKDFRGHSYGKQMIRAMEETILENGRGQAKLNAQTHAEAFYRHLGYETVSEEFMDAGIPHVTMEKNLEI